MKLNKKAHSVKRLSIEVEYPEEKTAKQAQEKVLYLAKNKLANILDNACIRYSSDLLVKVKNITLDLGDIPASEIERKLPQLFEKKINQILSGFQSKVYSQKGLNGVEVIDQEQQILIYFSYYLKYGTLPWYLQDVIGEYTFEEVFAYLIERNDELFKEEFFKLLENPNARRRLVRYFHSGEIMQVFKKSLPESLYSNIHFLYKEINQILIVSKNIESTHKDYLIMYLKEFLLIVSGAYKRSNESYSLDVLTKKYIDFVSSEKNISTEKWLPSILSHYTGSVKVDVEKESIFHALQDSYVEYLSEEKIEIPTKESGKIVDKEQFYNWLKEKQPSTSSSLIKAIEEIIKQIEKQFPAVQKLKLEQIVWRATFDIIPDMQIDSGNVNRWVYAIRKKAEELFGVSEVGLKETESQKQQKIISFQERKAKEFDISSIRDYLSLFLKSSLKPFKRIFSDPVKELQPLFEKYMQESEAKTFIREQVEDENIMVLWWVKEAFGDKFYADFEKIVSEGRKKVFPKEIKYDYLLLVSFFRTGVFPWVELIEKGKLTLLSKIEYFFTPEHRTKLTKVLVEEDFFRDKELMEKVFKTLPVILSKELLIIRKELIQKGILSKMDLDKFQELDELVKESTSEEENELRQKQEKEILKKRLVDSLVNQILEFSIEITPSILSKKEQADLIFEEILKSAKRSFYETASMIVSLEKNVIDALMQVFDKKQKDYIKKLVQNYRSRFVSIADEIKESEKRAEQLMALEAEVGETLYVNNAGLVLLNAYAKRLFDRFKLLDKKEFKSDEAKEKAVFILQYLVSKDNKPEEHELLLNKVLVGMPITAPFKFDVKISDEEKKICDGLLDAVIQNWTALKNTSRDGLRTSFLLRNGSLKKEEAAWQLRVEKKAFDILLNKLPWGYTMIHNPWMEFPLYTEWEDQKT